MATGVTPSASSRDFFALHLRAFQAVLDAMEVGLSDSGGAREAARGVLNRYLTEDQMKTLFEEVLASTKLVWVSCRHCNKKSQVEVPDAKAVVGGIADIVTKIADLPRDQEVGERIVFERIVYMSPDEDPPV